ncbi:MAG: PEP-CTERM sorting domain-containing protein [Planctomycetota bacterium]
MKKLLILLLVFGIASGANATLSLEVSIGGMPYGGEILAVGTTVDVKVVQDAPNTAGSGGEMTITMSASALSMTDTTPQFNSPEAGAYAGWDWLLNGGVSPIDNGDGTFDAWFGKTAQVSSSWGMPGTPGIGSWVGYAGYGGWAYESTVKFSFELTEMANLVWAGTWDGVDMTGVIGETIFPEPMTIALLGLGGLFLRRRK